MVQFPLSGGVDACRGRVLQERDSTGQQITDNDTSCGIKISVRQGDGVIDFITRIYHPVVNIFVIDKSMVVGSTVILARSSSMPLMLLLPGVLSGSN